MELRYRREVLVGMMLIVAAIGFVFMLMWLKGRTLRAGQIVTVTFSDVAGLKTGDQVRTAGVNVGTVRSIELDSAMRVRVVVGIRKKAPHPRTDASFAVRSLDLLGARYLEYRPGNAAELLPRGAVVEGVREPELADVAAGLAGEGRAVMANATELLGPRMANELRITLQEAQRTLATLARAGSRPSDTLVAALSDVRRLSQRLDILLARTTEPLTATSRNIERLTANMNAVTQTLAHTSVQMDSLLSRLTSGRGTAGALLSDTTMLSELMRTNRALGDLLVDIKANPGRYIRLRI
jgi:phospholipid/cholesterol/gamma-HCH transport system substrate-binding protein